jgi:SpoVK/Ycf46/Vps4 family AAA+-type ATPase
MANYLNLLRYIAGYSGSDMANLCREAGMNAIRSLALEDADVDKLTAAQV